MQSFDFELKLKKLKKFRWKRLFARNSYLLTIGSSLSLLFVIFITLAFRYENYYKKTEEESLKKLYRELVKSNLNHAITSVVSEELPGELAFEQKQYKIRYGFNQELDEYIRKLLKQYRSDYSSVVVIDNNTGKILSVVGHRRDDNNFDLSLPFTATHPSASLFKVITTADLLTKNISSYEDFSYIGRSSTLYRYQLNRENSRYMRRATLEKAFASSNNVVFGKAAIKYLSGESLLAMASNFGYKKSLIDEVDLPVSVMDMPEDEYSLAETASGFNTTTLMSPIHAAVISSVVANGGKLIYPTLVDAVVDETNNQIVWTPEQRVDVALPAEIASSLKNIMESTIEIGTARRSFKKMNRTLKEDLVIGGKTGSMTGGTPFGKRDWFTAFAAPRNDANDKGISIAVMNVNTKRWYVKSSYLAERIIDFYFSKIKEIDKKENQDIASKKGQSSKHQDV